MGFMDKLKAEAEQAMALAQRGADAAQTKFDAMQAQHAADGLLQALGLASYRRQHGEATDADVAAALAAVEAHVAQNGPLPAPVPQAPPAAPRQVTTPPAVPAPQPAQPAQPAPAPQPAAQEFHVDDL